MCAQDMNAPPTTNRGVHWTVGGVDNVGATVRGINPESLAEQFGSKLHSWQKMRGLNGYSDSLLGLGGFRICYTPRREDVHIIAPGKWLNLVSTRGQRELLEALTACGAVFTRIDLQLTDERPVATPLHVWEAHKRGDVVTRFKEWEWHESDGKRAGTSVYVGATSSAQRLVVYDKSAESRGEVEGIRWELRARKEAAETLAEQLLASQEWGKVWAGRVLSLVDFRDRSQDANSGRCPRLTWFEELVQGAEKMRAYPVRPLRSLDDVYRWLTKQVAPSLAMMVEAAGGDTEPLTTLALEGQSRLRETHRAMIDASRESGA